MKERLDILLVKRNLAPSREKAKAMIMEGNVFVNNQREDKAGSSFEENVPIEIHGNTLKYVSRGGLKLEKAMNEFGLTLDGDICMDIGASTGGFTDCMFVCDNKKLFHNITYQALHVQLLPLLPDQRFPPLPQSRFSECAPDTRYFPPVL